MSVESDGEESLFLRSLSTRIPESNSSSPALIDALDLGDPALNWASPASGPWASHELGDRDSYVWVVDSGGPPVKWHDKFSSWEPNQAHIVDDEIHSKTYQEFPKIHRSVFTSTHAYNYTHYRIPRLNSSLPITCYTTPHSLYAHTPGLDSCEVYNSYGQISQVKSYLG